MEQIRISWRWPTAGQFWDPKIYNGIDDLINSDLSLSEQDLDTIKKMQRGTIIRMLHKIRMFHNVVELKIEKL